VKRRAVLDAVGALRVEIADGIVGQRGQMHDRVESREVVRANIAQVAVDDRNSRRVVAEAAIEIVARVEAYDVVSLGGEELSEDRADVPVVPRHQHSHAAPPINR
jgi:hypothetical protein